MNESFTITENEIDSLYQQLKNDAAGYGYFLNPDMDFTLDLVKGILVNEKHYGYGACPGRLATGNKSQDLDIICPCDYRDPDLTEHGSCY